MTKLLENIQKTYAIFNSYKNAVKIRHTLTGNLDELEHPKNLESFQQIDYRKDPEFEALRASLSHLGWDLTTDCFATTYKNRNKKHLNEREKVSQEFMFNL